MAVNLVARYDRDTAERLLSASFAEFDRTRQQTSLLDEIAADTARLEKLRVEARHPSVDVFARLDDDGRSHAAVMAQFVASTSPGTVLEWEERGKSRRVVVVAVGRGKQPRLLGVTEDGAERRLASGRMPATVRAIGTVTLPKPFRPRDAGYRATIADRLTGFVPDQPPRTAYELLSDDGEDISHHLEAARSARRLEARIESRKRQAAATGPAIVRRFGAITKVLERRGYVRGWRLTEKGTRLRTIYNELDLLLVESLEAGVWDGVDAAGAAGLASAFTFQPRHSDGPDRWPQELAGRGTTLDGVWEALVAAERSAGVAESRQPDPGFATSIMAWVSGATLRDLFDDGDPAVGDFVRSARQLIDLLRQIDDAGLVPGTAIRDAVRAIDRGVVAAAGSV
jgi:ATP-dependent RNA helicase HelY